MSERLRATTPENRAAWSARLGERLLDLRGALLPGQAMAVFGGIKSEPDLLPAMHALWDSGVPLALFAMEGHVLHPYRVRDEMDIQRGQMGVWEPRRDEDLKVPLEELGVVLVPGLIFDRSVGARLGRGAGFYDRMLGQPEVTALRVGVGFSLQMCERLPHEAHDMHMQMLVSEEGWWDVGRQIASDRPVSR